MDEEKDPLDELIVDEAQPADKSIIAKALQGKVTITKEGVVNYNEGFHGFPQWKKIMLFLLARKVIKLKDIGASPKENVSLKEIEDGAFMPAKSASRALAINLYGIVKKSNGGYYIPNYCLARCQKILEGKEKIPDIRRSKKGAKNG